MKTNLLYFTPKSSMEKRAIESILPAFSYGTMSSIVCKTELANFAESVDIAAILGTNSLIMLDFSIDEQFQKVQKAVNSVFRTTIQNTDFGGFCEAKGKFCSIINIGKSVRVDTDELHKLYKVNPSICLKLWGIEVPQIFEKCSTINNFSSLNYVAYDNFGDVTLAIESCADTYLKQELYGMLSEYIYIEEFRTLLDCVAELGSVRKREFGVLDFTGEILPELTAIPELKPFVVNMADLGATKSTTLGELKTLLHARKLNFIALIAPQRGGHKVIFLDEEVHTFDFPPEKEFEYVKNFVYFKILNKLKKNTFLY